MISSFVNRPPGDMPEFFATPDVSNQKAATLAQTNASLRLMFHRSIRKIDYNDDGRKVNDGSAIELTPSKLWEELLVRSVAVKITDDVKCPKQAMAQMAEDIPPLTNLTRLRSRSMYSLVSDFRLTAELQQQERRELLEMIKAWTIESHALSLAERSRPRARSVNNGLDPAEGEKPPARRIKSCKLN